MSLGKCFVELNYGTILGTNFEPAPTQPRGGQRPEKTLKSIP